MFSGPTLAALLTVSVVGNVYLFLRLHGTRVRGRRSDRALRALIRQGDVHPSQVSEALEADRADAEGMREVYRRVADEE